MAFKNIKGHSILLIMNKIQGKSTEMPISYPIKLTKIQTFDLNIKTLRLREPDTIIYYYWKCKQV